MKKKPFPFPGLCMLIFCTALFLGGPFEARGKDTCVDCHGNPDFFVTNKKLYQYFQDWTLSRHKQEEVTCVDCHGGDPEAVDKRKAHGKAVGSSKSRSLVGFKKIPTTCGKCHDDTYSGFIKSRHFQQLIDKKQSSQGPSCVTCHGAMNIAALNVNTVKKVCSVCHNQKSSNHPEIPDKAENLLNRFLSIHRFFRFVSIRGEPEKSREFLSRTDDMISDLSIDWHTFDLDKIDKSTRTILELLKAKRDEIKKK